MTEEKLTPQEEVIKRYLEEQIKKDEALRTLYIPNKIKDCFAYIKAQAQKKASNGCTMIEDAVVFKWARDYYLEELPKKANKEVVELVSKNDMEQEPEIEETAESVPETPKEENEVAEEINGIKYDKDGFGLLF